MNSIQDYDPDQHENEEKYWGAMKRIYDLEEKIDKMDKPNKDSGIEDMTDKWVFDQLTTISECLKLLIDNGKNQITVNKRTEDTIRKLNKAIDDMAGKSKANRIEKDSSECASSDKVGVVGSKCYIHTMDDFDWELDEKGGFAFSDLAEPDDGPRTDGSDDPANTKTDTSNSVKVMGPTIVNPIGREYSYCIDGDRLEYIIHLMVRQDYHPTTIRYGERGVKLIFSKNTNTMVTKTLHLDRI